MKRRHFLFALTLPLAGCGFQLRGAQRIPYRSVYIQATDRESAIVRQLEQALKDNQVVLGTSAREAEAVLVLSQERKNRSILALSGGGRVREYRLNYAINYSLNDRDGKTIFPDSLIQLTRDFTYDDNLYLAKTAEEAFLYRDLEEDAIQQILRRLRSSH
jgi:LPS-assembly lipoprotein